MSWSTYVSNLEQGPARCTYAGIFGKNPISPWAESTNKATFPITTADVERAYKAISSNDQNIMGTGFKVGGNIAFTCLKMQDDHLICQGKGDHKDYSLVIVVSGQAIIVALNADPDIKAAMVFTACETMKDYLKSVGY